MFIFGNIELIKNMDESEIDLTDQNNRLIYTFIKIDDNDNIYKKLLNGSCLNINTEVEDIINNDNSDIKWYILLLIAYKQLNYDLFDTCYNNIQSSVSLSSSNIMDMVEFWNKLIHNEYNEALNTLKEIFEYGLLNNEYYSNLRKSLLLLINNIYNDTGTHKDLNQVDLINLVSYYSNNLQFEKLFE